MMRYSTTALILLLLVAAATGPIQGQNAAGAARAAESDTIRVALPTGVAETDRASILAALEEVEPGGTILFEPGTYLVGTIMLVPQSEITLQAHPSGTTLRGCHPGEAGESVLDCGVMVLQGGGVTLRGFTIEQSQLGVCISHCRGDPQAPVGDTVGGYRIEDNTFRNSMNGVRGQVVSSDTSVIRDNRFINTFHAVSFLAASNLHVVDNRISAPAPAEMPGPGHVSFAIGPAEFLAATDSLGTVEEGKLADLVLLDANPLEDITNTQRIAAVVLGGRHLDRGELDELLKQAEGAASRSQDAARDSLASEGPSAGEEQSDTVHVAPATGDKAADRANVQAAFDAVQPGGTVLFAPGTYHVGEVIPLETPRVTLLGHPDGTTLRGCDPAGYEELQREAVRAIASGEPDAAGALHRQCGMFALTGGHVTVRDLTFEYSRLGLLLGCCHADEVLRPSPGGYRIEGNTFRNSGNSIRAILAAAEPTVIRGNRFINTFHALSATASRLHVLDNEISMPEPGRVPGTGHPGFAIGITALPPGRIVAVADVCEQNIIAGNRIDGHPDGILLSARQPGASCRENVVRDNTIQVRRVRFPAPWLYADLIPLTSPEDSTFVGVPLALSASTAGSDSAEEDSAPARVEDNRVEDNRIDGAEGLGMAISHASRNRIAGNTITGIERREPFPGNRVGWLSTEWREANGSGLWVSPGSDENEIVGNAFEDVAGAAIVLEGDGNRVELRSADDSVSDLGAGNRVTEPEPGAEAGADHHMHIQTAELTRIVDAGQRASGGSPKDAPPLSAHTAADAIEALDAAGLQHGLVLSGAYIWGSPLLHSPMGTAILDSLGVEIGDERARVRAENEYLSEQVARHPERLVGACSVNPLKDYALEEVELCEGDPHIRAFKVHLFAAGADLTNTVHVARLRSFFQALDEADLSALVHLRNRVEGYGAEDAGIFIREILAAAPDLPVQIAHMAGQGPYDAATDSAMQAFVDAFEDGTLERDRLTFDMGALIVDPHALEGDTAKARRATERNRRLAARMREVGIERVVIGTDWPAFPPEGDARTRIARAQALLRRVLPLEAEELDRFFANVGPVFRR